MWFCNHSAGGLRLNTVRFGHGLGLSGHIGGSVEGRKWIRQGSGSRSFNRAIK